MNVVLNGERREVPASTVAELLQQLQLADRRVAVMVGGDIVPRAEHATRALAEGDTIDIISLIGGG